MWAVLHDDRQCAGDVASDRNMREIEMRANFVVAVACAVGKIDFPGADVDGIESPLDECQALLRIQDLFGCSVVNQRVSSVVVIERNLAANVRPPAAV
jgi:hypothetical protein